MDKEAFLKINYFLNNTNKSKTINLIHFCENVSDLAKFNLANKSEISYQINANNLNLIASDSDRNELNFNILFLIKREYINMASNNNASESIRYNIKQNVNLIDSWYATILYVSKNLISMCKNIFFFEI